MFETIHQSLKLTLMNQPIGKVLLDKTCINIYIKNVYQLVLVIKLVLEDKEENRQVNRLQD